MECEIGKPDAGIIKAADGSVRERVRKMLRQIPLSPENPFSHCKQSVLLS